MTSLSDNNNGTEVEAGIYVPIREAVNITSIPPQSLRKYADEGAIKSYKTPSGHRRFLYEDLQRMRGTTQRSVQYRSRVPLPVKRIDYIYVRAATEEAAKEQIQFITARLESNHVESTNRVIISDVGMGSGFTKYSKGMVTLIDASLRGVVGEVTVAHRDRMDRLAYTMLQFVVHKAGGRIVSLDAEEFRATDAELAEDMFEVLHKFKSVKKTTSCRAPTVGSDPETVAVAAEVAAEEDSVEPKKRRGRPPRLSVTQA